jgi:hypothetical protein
MGIPCLQVQDTQAKGSQVSIRQKVFGYRSTAFIGKIDELAHRHMPPGITWLCNFYDWIIMGDDDDWELLDDTIDYQ